jgi:putative ABC transport system substrate-binding protein
VNRRDFVTLLGGAAATMLVCPLAARGQQSERVRRIGVLMNLASDDPEGQARNAAFLQALQEFGWTVGRNVRIDYRWTAGDADSFRKYAAQLVALSPDVILAATTPAVSALQQASRTVPIVFVGVTDPVSQGFVTSLARPGANTTGFAVYEYGMGAKWLGVLKEIVPGLTRVAVLRDPTLASTSGQLGAIQGMAPSLGVEVSPLGVLDAGEIERGITAFVRGSNEGLIVLPSPLPAVHRELIISLAARHRLPGIYGLRFFVR